METVSRSRKRKDYSHLAASSSVVTRSRLRLNDVTGDTSDGCVAEHHSSSVGQFTRSTGDGVNAGSEVLFVRNRSHVAAVKDLRVHRVFSSASIGSLDLMEMDVADRKKDYSSVKDCAVNGDEDNCVVGKGEIEADLDCGRSLDDAWVGDRGMRYDAGVCFESNVICSGQNGAPKVGQECVRTTPPDVVLEETDRTVLTSDQKTFEQSMGQGLNKASNSSPEGSHQQLPGRHSPCSRNQKPCLRPELSGNPSSFRQRGLLPYLMNLTKGALKCLDKSSGAKPELKRNVESSLLMSSLSALEPQPISGTESSYLFQAIIPYVIPEPKFSICNENTANTEVPLNSNKKDSEESVSKGPCNWSYEQAKSSTNPDNDLSQSGSGKVTLDLGGMASGVDGKDAYTMVYSDAMHGSHSIDYPSQQSPGEYGSAPMDVLCDVFSGKCLGVGDVPGAENSGVNYDTAQSNICGQKIAEFVQERPLSKVALGRKYVIGMGRSIVKHEDQIDDGIIPSKKNIDHEQFVVSESNMVSNKSMSGSNCIDSPAPQLLAENRSVLIDVLGDCYSCERPGSGDVYTAKTTGICSDKLQTEIFIQKTADFVQETPLCNDEHGGKDVLRKVKPNLKTENQIGDAIITNMKNSDFEKFVVSADKKHSSYSERKLYLKPRRLKIFKNSNSLSYRRLLPYLKEIYGDGTCILNEDQLKKVGKAVKAGDSILKNHSIGTSIGGTTWHGDSNPINTSSSVVKPELTNFEQSYKLDVLTDSLADSQSVDRSKSLIDLQILSHGDGPTTQLLSSSRGPNSLSIGESVEKSQYIISKLKEDGMRETMQHDDLFHLNNDVIRSEPNTLLGRPFVCPTGGILKRNPRGCRGLCTCIKCASFRLHAEKAFEFSRNQLLDSEEIALELINELSLLRNLLEKSAGAENDNASVKSNQVQVREACRKAYQIEHQTKARFEQMNHDLKIHCQIPTLQRPTVSFVKHFEEKVIQKNK